MKPAWLVALMIAALGVAESPAAGLDVARQQDGHEMAGGEYRVWGELIVREPISRMQLDVFTDQMEQIWAPYGVTFSWYERPPASGVPDGFSDWIRILIDRDASALQKGDRRRPAMAALQITTGGTPRNVLYISFDAARWVLSHIRGAVLSPAARDTLAARFAGRAAAHELGHYLLRSAEHAEEGLMRREFTRADLLDASFNRFRLTPVEAVALSNRLFTEREALVASHGPDQR